MAGWGVKVEGLAGVQSALRQIGHNHVPAATVMALNNTAYDALGAVKDGMKLAFDRPTPFALNAFMVWRATPQRMVAEVKERPSVGPRHFLKVQQSGGVRPNTALEKLMQARVPSASYIAAITPAVGARRDGFGNWSSGERNQVLSALGAQRDRLANATPVSKARGRRTGRADYFVPKEGSSLSPGVYRREGRNPVKVINFTSTMPAYEKRIDFTEIVRDTAARVYETHFATRLGALINPYH